jgi:hypothetical protein
MSFRGEKNARLSHRRSFKARKKTGTRTKNCAFILKSTVPECKCSLMYIFWKTQDEFLYSQFWGYFHAGKRQSPGSAPTPTTTLSESGVPCVTYSLDLLLVSRIIRRPDRYRSEGLICLAFLSGCCKNLVHLPIVAGCDGRLSLQNHEFCTNWDRKDDTSFASGSEGSSSE